MSFRLNVSLLVRSLSLIALAAALSAQSNPRPHQKTGQSQNAKCTFLWQEAQRVRRDGQDYFNRSPLAGVKTSEDLAAAGATLGDWANFTAATEVFAAREGFFRQAASACQRNISLSDSSRLNEISAMRSKQVKRLLGTWQRLAGDQGKDLEGATTAQLSAAYEAETKSFYNPELSQFNDPDIGKDYPDLLPLIQSSSLNQATKDFYAANARFLHYEEAGQLANILKGIDSAHGLDFAYLLRKRLSDRAATAAQQQEQLSGQQEKDRKTAMTNYALEAFGALVLITVLGLWSSRAAARRHGIRTGAPRSPYWGGSAEWIFWEPGETVVLLENKRLVIMPGSDGGYRSISAWRGQEYKGRISYKTQFSTWTSDPILTSDGLAVRLGLSVWWKITEAKKFVMEVAADYHAGNHHHAAGLSTPDDVRAQQKENEYWTKEAADFWIRNLAAGTLREQINLLPAEKLISPYVQTYIQVARAQASGQAAGLCQIETFSGQLGNTRNELNRKAIDYGISVEKLEVPELILPAVYQQKLEAVRIAFLEPHQQTALTEAQKIALRGLADVIGEDKVGLIEVLKHVDLSHVSANPFTGVIPMVQPIINDVQQHTERALPSTSTRAAAANASLPPASRDGKPT